MILLFVIYIINISFIIQAENCTVLKDINIKCQENSYYNSIKCFCENCSSSVINENICYNSGNFKSIYNPNDVLNCKDKDGGNVNCSSLSNDNDRKYSFTELDSEGKWLGFLMPAQNYPEEDDQEVLNSIPSSFTFKIYSLIDSDNKNPTPGDSQNLNIIQISKESVAYYYKSCIKGYYDNSCNFLLNLCVVGMYDINNFFCQKIEELSTELSLSIS